MAQVRFHNYNRPLQSFAENLRLLGFIRYGVYAGFDGFTVDSGTDLLVNHLTTGLVHTKENGAADVPRGVVMSRQGTVVHEDAAIPIVVDTNVGNAFPRIDVLVMQHSYINSPGGAAANYSIIKGAVGGAVEPPLSNTLIQTKLGRFIVPAEAADHSNTRYERAEIPKLGGEYAFGKVNETDIPGVPSLYSNDFNLLTKSGFYFISSTLNRPTSASNDWFVIVVTKNGETAQLAQAKTTGKIYSRGYNSTTEEWGPWINLNNPDVETAVTDLQTAVGNRLYSENNYVVDNESLTSSIDSLDIALKDVADALTTAQTNISNLQINLGNLQYTNNNFLADGESVTASLDKLDDFLKTAGINYKANYYASNADCNTMLKAGVQVVIRPTNANCPGDSNGQVFVLHTAPPNGVLIVQTAILHNRSTSFSLHTAGTIFKRQYNTGTLTWSAWTELGSGVTMRRKSLPNWDMNTDLSKVFAHGLTGTEFARVIAIFVMVYKDDFTQKYPLNRLETSIVNGEVSGGISYIDDTNISVVRVPGLLFDGANYSSTAQSRGTVIFLLEPEQ